MAKQRKLDKVNPKDFDDLYGKKSEDGNDDWKEIFENYINHISDFSISNNFWFIGDFFTPQILKIAGDYKTLTPWTEKEWFNLESPASMEKIFHPADVAKMKSFTAFFAGYLSSKKESERPNIKASMVFRMMNAKGVYTWRVMQYPHIHFFNGFPRYLLCLISDYNHLLSDANCTMYILDENSKESTLYYCDDEQVELKSIDEKSNLSKRELQIVELLAQGLISKEIATQLGISKNTIENHKQNIFTKTKTKNIAELVGYAHRVLFKNNFLNKH